MVGDEAHLWLMFDRVMAAEDAGNDPNLEQAMLSVVTIVASSDNQVVYYDQWEDGFDPALDTVLAGGAPVAFQASTLIFGNGDSTDGRACDVNPSVACIGTDPGDDNISQGDALLLNSDEGDAANSCDNETSLPPTTGTYPEPDLHGCVPGTGGANNFIRSATDLRFDGGDRIAVSGGPAGVVHTQEPELDPVHTQGIIAGATEMLSKQALANATSYSIPVGEDIYAGDGSVTEPFQYTDLNIVAFEDTTSVTVDSPVAGAVSFTLDRGQHYSSEDGTIEGDGCPCTAPGTLVINAGTKISTDKPIAGLLFTGSDGNFQTRFYAILPDLLHGKDYITTAPGDDDAADGDPDSNPTSGVPDDRPLNIYIFNPDPVNSIEVTATDSINGSTTFTVAANSQVDYVTQVDPTGVPDAEEIVGSSVATYIPSGSTVRLTSDRNFWGISAYEYDDVISDWGHSWLATQFLTETYTVSYAPDLAADDTSAVHVAAIADNTCVQVDFDNDGTFDAIGDGMDGQLADPGSFTCAGAQRGYVIDALQTLPIWDPTDDDNTGTRIVASKPVAVADGQHTDFSEGGQPLPDYGYTVYPVQQAFLDPVLVIGKTVDVTTVPTAGDRVTYTIEISAFDFGPFNAHEIFDLLPSGVGTLCGGCSGGYVTGSTVITFPDLSTDTADPVVTDNGDGRDRLEWTLNFRDNFDSAVYTNQDGTFNWATDWTETDDGGSGAGAGDILITAGQLRLSETPSSGNVPSVEREADLSSFTTARLQFDYQLTGGIETDDHLRLEILCDDGSNLTILEDWLGLSSPESESRDYDITSHVSCSADAVIRFTVVDQFHGSDEFFFVDNLQISGNRRFEAFNPNETVTIEYQVDLPSGSNAVLSNEAHARASLGGSLFEPTATASVSRTDIEISKTVTDFNGGGAEPGDILRYTITVTNNGSGSETDPVITDPVPNFTTFCDSGINASCTDPTGTGIFAGIGAHNAAQNAVIWDASGNSFAASASETLTFDVVIDPAADGGDLIENTADYESTETLIAQSNATQTTVAAPQVDVAKRAVGKQDTYRDEFETAAFTNNDGSLDWAADWQEQDGDGPGPTAGNATIENGELGLDDFPDTGAAVFLAREADLSGTQSATLTFDFRITADTENGDEAVVEVSSSGTGGPFTVLETFTVPVTGPITGSRSYDISDHISSTTAVRFRIETTYSGTNERFLVDNLQIQVNDVVFPNEIVTYEVSIANTGTASATAVFIEDLFPTNGAYQNESMQFQSNGGGLSALTDAASDDQGTELVDRVQFALGTYADDFDVVSYSNSDGSLDWSGDAWTELDEADGPALGDNQVTGGNLFLSNQLAQTPPTARIRRQADTSTFSTARLSFDFDTGAGVTPSDGVLLQISSDGSSFDTLDTFSNLSGGDSGTRRYDVSAYLSATTTILWTVISGYTAANASFLVDNLQIGDGLGAGEDLDFHFEVLVTGSAGQTLENQATVSADEITTADTNLVQLDIVDPDVTGVVYLDNGAGVGTADNGTQDGSEPCIADIDVVITDFNSSATFTVTTDSNGRYFFNGLTTGGASPDSRVDPDETDTDFPAGATACTAAPAPPDYCGDFADFDFTGVAIVANLGYVPPPLAITKASDAPGGEAAPGDVLTYTVNLTDTSAAAHTNVLITDPIPADATYVASSMSWQLNGGGFTALTDTNDGDEGGGADGRAIPVPPGTTDVEFRLASINANDSIDFRFQVTVDDPLDPAPSDIDNTATSTSDSTGNVSDQLLDPIVRPDVSVEPNSAIELVEEPNDGNTTLDSAEQVVFYHAVINDGDTADSYDITAFSEQGYVIELIDPSSGLVLATDSDGNGVWDPEPPGGAAPNTGSLSPGESVDYQLRITVPSGTAVDAVETTELRATSLRQPSRNASALDEIAIVDGDKSGVGDILVDPDHSTFAAAGDRVVYTHLITNNTGATDTFDLALTTPLAGWTVQVFQDADGDGVYVAANDGPAIANTSPLADTASQLVFVVIDVSGGASVGDVDTTRLTASSQADSNLQGIAVDTTTVEDNNNTNGFNLGGNGTQTVDANDVHTFPGTLVHIDTDFSGSDPTEDFEFTITASPNGLRTELSVDTDADGVPDTVIAIDATGDGVWDVGSIPAGFDDDGDFNPDVDVNAGDSLAYAIIRTAPGAGRITDSVTITVSDDDTTADQDSVTFTTVLDPPSPAALIEPNGAAIVVEETDVDTVLNTTTTVVYALRVMNEGNVTDNFELFVFSDQSGAGTPWVVRLREPGTGTLIARDDEGDGSWEFVDAAFDSDTDGDPDTGSLLPGADVDYQLEYEVPGDGSVSVGDTGTVELQADSDVSGGTLMASGFYEVTVIDGTIVGAGDVVLTPNNSSSVVSPVVDTGVVYTHVLTNETGSTDVFDLTAVSDQSFTVRIYLDDGNDVFDGTESQVTDSGTLADGASAVLFVEVVVPASTAEDTVDVTTLTATSQAASGLSGTATDTTTVESDNNTNGFDLSGGGVSEIAPTGTGIFPGTLTNEGVAADIYELRISDSPNNLTVELVADTDMDGDIDGSDNIIAQDTDGDGVWDNIDPEGDGSFNACSAPPCTFDNDGDGEPDISLAGGAATPYELHLTDPGVGGSFTDSVTFTAADGNGGFDADTDSVTSTVIVDGGVITGHVFLDDGTGGGTAGDGMQNGGEPDLANVDVR